MSEFKGMTALVTGASNGIGAAAAVGFARSGAHVLVHYCNARDAAEKVMAEVCAAGGTGEILQGDLSASEGVYRFIDLVARTNRPVDILVNNAGSLIKRTRLLEFTDELWNQVFMLNLHSAFMITRALMPGMVERKRGCVVNISSVAARNGGGLGAMAYASAKGALSVMTKGLAKEFAPHGVRVNAVSPGTIDTNYHRTFSTEQMLAGVRAATPLGRLGTSEEVAGVILFLCSKGAEFVHGQVIEVNGGFLMV
jgi:3-oxoacyl-[acyl-carrier protein] reductase